MTINRVDGRGGRVRGRGLVMRRGTSAKRVRVGSWTRFEEAGYTVGVPPLDNPFLGGGLTSWPEANQWVTENLNSVLPGNKRPCRGLSKTVEFELLIDSAFPVTY